MEWVNIFEELPEVPKDSQEVLKYIVITPDGVDMAYFTIYSRWRTEDDPLPNVLFWFRMPKINRK